MNQILHPIEPEELMAYLDGELTADRASATAAHLSECSECQRLVAELRSVSQNLQSWKVEPPESAMSSAIANALAENQPESRKTTSSSTTDVAGGFEPALADPRVGGNCGSSLRSCVQHS